MIKLVEDTISYGDIEQLIEWLKTNPKLTQGEVTKEFEKQWSKWLGVKYSTYVNSGSSANLLMLYALKLSNRLKSNVVIVPAVSWATTVAPLIQLGFEPILVECDKKTLGIDLDDLNRILLDLRLEPAALIAVNVLGFPCQLEEIRDLCNYYDVVLLEDSCETLGSTSNKYKTGTFGTMSTFSLYFGHHLSTIEGGMICTNDDELNNILKMIRSHGWDRDISKKEQDKLRAEYNIDGFKNNFTFYYPGFNLRATDLQARIGLEQIKKIDDITQKRDLNFRLYDKLIVNDYWKISSFKNETISNFAYPIIHPKRDLIVERLEENKIECRPLVCGSMAEQPFFKKVDKYKRRLPFAQTVNDYGMYVPNNPNLSYEQINFICTIINDVIN